MPKDKELAHGIIVGWIADGMSREDAVSLFNEIDSFEIIDKPLDDQWVYDDGVWINATTGERVDEV